jgi:hypothetical protein
MANKANRKEIEDALRPLFPDLHWAVFNRAVDALMDRAGREEHAKDLRVGFIFIDKESGPEELRVIGIINRKEIYCVPVDSLRKITDMDRKVDIIGVQHLESGGRQLSLKAW